MKVKSESEVTQSCPTLSDPMDCTLPGSLVHGIFQARVLEWGAIAFSKHTLKYALFSNHSLNCLKKNCIQISSDLYLLDTNFQTFIPFLYDLVAHINCGLSVY